MGFDIECIIDIHTYPGEYFCPVCRTLVYPNEAFQAQCTHLYCKPCLAHIANGTRACPYDGYLVTEADSKLLMDSDKTLAENIGKVKVHCLFFRSGCTWEGSLSDCTSHCASCTFGNSPVICNRCGIQIVHRQVHDHAQSCPGAYGGQQAVAVTSATTRPAATVSSVTAETTQTMAQSGAPSQVQNSQNVTATPVPGQNPMQQVNVNSQAPGAAPVNVPTPDQWYQQQYQQYYQQYMGYYQQQPNQQYYQFQQQPFQQYPQHSAQMQGQLQSQVHPQSVPQAHLQPQAQPHQQAQAQAQAQAQSQSQPQQQPPSHPMPVSQGPQQPHLQPQAQGQAQQQPQLQMPPQVQLQAQVPPQPPVQGQALVQGVAPNYQANPQQPSHPPMRPQTQQALPPPPHSHSAQPLQFPQGTGMRPPAQPPQVPQYQQPQIQPHHPASQFHVQPQMQPQPQPVSSNLPYVHAQPQVQSYSAPSAAVFPPQAGQSAGPAALPQAQHLPGPPVSGHHPYQQPNPAQKIPPGSSQQHPMPPPPTNAASVHPAQVHGQVPHQLGVMRPPPQVSMTQQQPSTLLPPQNQAPFIPPPQHQQFPPHAQPPLQNRPVAQPVQQALPHQYGVQQHFPPPLQSQLHQQPTQPQMRPSGHPHLQQPQNYTGRPVTPNQGIHQQSLPFPSDVGALAHSGPGQLSSTQMPTNQNYTKSTALDNNETAQETRSPSRAGEIVKEKAVTGKVEATVSEADNVAKDIRNNIGTRQEGDNVHGSLDQTSAGKSFEAGTTVKNEVSKLDGHSMADSDSLKQVNLENQKLSAVSQGSHLPRPEVQVQGQPPSVPGSQGAVLPHPGQSLKPDEGRPPGYGPPKVFEHQSTLHGPTPPTQAYPHGMGRVLLNEGQMSKDQMSGAANPPGTGEGAVAKGHVEEPNFYRKNGGTAPESMYGSKDEKFTAMAREHMNPVPGEAVRPFDQASRPLDKAAHGPIHEAGPKMNPGSLGPYPRFFPPHDPSGGHGNPDMFGSGPEFGQHPMKHFSRRSPGREYFGSSPHGFGDPTSFPRGTSTFDDIASREVHNFGEGSRSFNLPSGRAGNPFHDARFPPLSGHPRADLDGAGNPRFGEFRAPGSDGVFGPDGPRGKFSGPGYFPGNFGMPEPGPGPGAFPGHGRGRELGGLGNYPRPPFSEPVRGDQFAHFGEPAMQNYSFPGFPNPRPFSGGMDSFESWKRKPVSTGWCRICEVDCESVEGLELHSQTREHQKMAMDMVKSIKMQNKRQRTGGHMVHDGGNRSRKAGIAGRGSNP